MKIVITLLLCSSTFIVKSQDALETFNETRILNAHSNETLKKKILQFRIEHRFGDMAGSAGGAQEFFGFDNAADIRFAFEYGVTDKLMIGLGRSKGTGAPYRSLVDGFVKYKVLEQNKAKQIPVGVSLFGASTITYMKANEDLSLVQSFPKFSHRMTYVSQAIISRKFNDRFSMAILPTYVHRNLVLANDIKGLFSCGAAISLKITKGFGILGEYFYNFHDNEIRTEFKNSLSAGLEWLTNGHNFKLVITNAKGFNEVQYIAGNTSDWSKGQFRLGFSISRNFKL
jgi:hypothetical protein